jgi:translocation and assembly module TamB
MKRRVHKWVKRFLIFLASVVCLVLAFVIFLHTSWGRSVVRNKVEKYLRNKLQTTVSIGKIDYRLPNWIHLKNVIILDQRNDTLLRGGSLYVKLNMLKLLSQNVEIDGIELEQIDLHLGREAGDSSFNFQFITDAFSSPTTEVDTTTPSKPMQLSVNYVLLNDFILSFNDKKEKKYFSADLHHFYCSPRHLDLGGSSYELNDLVASNCQVTIVDSSLTVKTNDDNESTPEKKNDSKSSPFLFDLKKIGLRNFSFSYKKPLEQIDFSASFDSLQLDETAVDLQKNSISSQKFTLSNSAIKFLNWIPAKAPAKNEEVLQQVAADNDWTISIDDVALRNNSFIYHNQAMSPVNGLDYNHIVAKQINLSCKQNIFSAGGFRTAIDNFSTIVNDHLNLKGLRTTATYTDSSLSIKNLA